MKYLLVLSFTLASLAGAFTIPKGSHHLGEIDEVAKQAALKKQAVAFVITTKKMAAT
ncbi:MAG: hypothetical protein ACON5H_08765 [Akkermansiaceae bacterium]